MATTLIFGTCIKKISILLVPPNEKDKAESLAIQKKKRAVMDKVLTKRVAKDVEEVEFHEEIVHPNEEKDSDSDSDSKTETAG